MKKQKNNLTTGKAFTLIELLVVIAIIGILASVVLVSTQSATLKAKRASAITTASSVMPELVTCNDDQGYAKTTITAGAKICCTDTGCGTFAPGHTATWPDITNTGWAYDTYTGTIIGGDFSFKIKLVSDNTQVITCSMAGNGCI